MKRCLRQKTVSLLGVLAILMATLAPAMSQALAAPDALKDALTRYCTTPASFADDAASHPSAPLAFHWQACAYCGLLADVPVVPGAATLFAVPLLPAFSKALAGATASLHYLNPLIAAQPRAPPVLA
ncbi:DUF2946 domain-containing protein [Paraburkholderia bonniea]|uniref:DUF2946 domain-containing protein n=1 Tax=Paraburkholderia bonniea TaxID=2152891 RepID=UPI001290F269|nr:DUF2946 domain-containing protein [Paraburkholderia bonniea]WJF92024.1 DUF2946 domain-containing protein [Paraburkholderia bonniea]WJF95344.1 DUF2946 domain-containing protein [Paraburkholderia bonniea]